MNTTYETKPPNSSPINKRQDVPLTSADALSRLTVPITGISTHRYFDRGSIGINAAFSIDPESGQRTVRIFAIVRENTKPLSRTDAVNLLNKAKESYKNGEHVVVDSDVYKDAMGTQLYK